MMLFVIHGKTPTSLRLFLVSPYQFLYVHTACAVLCITAATIVAFQKEIRNKIMNEWATLLLLLLFPLHGRIDTRKLTIQLLYQMINRGRKTQRWELLLLVGYNVYGKLFSPTGSACRRVVSSPADW